MPSVIKVENLSKAYQLGELGTGTISRDLERYWARIRGKEDPFLKIGEVNDRTTKSTSNVVWSLKDISFEVEQGDSVGIIGRNGAGKSTLLKILSRITSPTNGSAKVKGRIASLLEVGTGFHPELTGKENIFLNGAIQGMRKTEIKRKFDEIVDFSGVERYIDTPVKRYSSGMYVRLAFAVAAYLESEILIVDEVLAVGDAEFQKKCLGKIGDVSKSDGRTVIFVSHNMGAIRQLCSRAIVLANGLLTTNDIVENAIPFYLKTNITNGELSRLRCIGPLVKSIAFKEFSVNGVLNREAAFAPTEDLNLRLKFTCLQDVPRFRTSVNFYKDSQLIFTIHKHTWPVALTKGDYVDEFSIPNRLRPGTYTLGIGGHDGDPISEGREWIYIEEAYSFTVTSEWSEMNDFSSRGMINVPVNPIIVK